MHIAIMVANFSLFLNVVSIENRSIIKLHSKNKRLKNIIVYHSRIEIYDNKRLGRFIINIYNGLTGVQRNHTILTNYRHTNPKPSAKSQKLLSTYLNILHKYFNNLFVCSVAEAQY